MRVSEKKSDIFRPICRQTAQKGAEKQCRTVCAIEGGRGGGEAADRPPEVSFDFWLDGPNRVEELGSEISDVSIV